jgi:hypothetical protein
MANKKKWLGILATVLVFGMTVVGCDDSSTNSGGGGGQSLPAASGTNAVSGKTYFEWSSKTVFSATADGAANGAYTIGWVERDEDGDVLVNGKYKYIDIETGAYTWNEEKKTVTLKPEKVAFQGPNGFGELVNQTAYRASIQAMLDEMKAEMGEAAFNAMANEQLAASGFSSIAAYINYTVAEAFSNKTNGYSFSTDGTALFLEQALPANKGTNEFSGQTYYGMTWEGDGDDEKRVKEENKKYVFTASGYTFTNLSSGGTPDTITGTYAYDSNMKQIWLRPEKINGKDRQAIYVEQTAWNGHYYADDNACRAAQTNDQFGFWPDQYNSTNKTIGWED